MDQESSKARVVVVDDQNISRGFFEMYVRAAAKYELAAGLRTAVRRRCSHWEAGTLYSQKPPGAI